MRGDFSRLTFRKNRHYSGVRLQQGRVQLDADFNEQADIQAHRDQTTTRDAVGPRGAPLQEGGFSVSVEGNALKIGGGRLYVDGILCENDIAKLDLTTQPDLPGVPLPTAQARYLAYLDVWQRHITALEDPSLREVALGGPDTATRTRTVWQVKLKKIKTTDNCGSFGEEWMPRSTGRLRAQAQPDEDADDICAVPPGAGYTRLENQLYRVEIHDGGQAYGEGQRRSSELVSVVENIVPSSKKVKVANDGRVWKVEQWVELFSKGSTAPGTLARITAVDNRTLTLSEAVSSIVAPRLRRVATFKFSRDNGAVVSKMEEITGDFVTVSDPGKDSVLQFAAGQWVELSDEGRTLRGEPGVLVRLGPVNGNDLKVIWPNNTPLIMAAGFPTSPTVRRWDVKEGPIPVTTGAWLELEDGVQVEFEAGTYRTGDYWWIPARTLTGDVEWPRDNTGPTFEKRRGIGHHYCPLAILELAANNSWMLVQDCRRLFPPLTELTSLHYVSGDGQEAMPDGVLPRRLQVRVLNGNSPVAKASVEFRITPGTGGSGIVQVAVDSIGTVSGSAVTAKTDSDGMAECGWKLDATTQSQQVEAFLLDESDERIPLPIRFNANLSVAHEVAYDPGSCNELSGANTVQKAMERISNLSSLYYVGGDGQEVMPVDRAGPQPLEVLVANACGPVAQARVRFEVVEGGGRLNENTIPAEVLTDANGIASCEWELGPAVPTQRATATLISAPDVPGHQNPIHEPLTVRFVANLSLAEQVAYVPPEDCPPLQGTATVKGALDALCGLERGGCCSVTVGRGGRYETLQEAFENLKDRANVCICLLPGDYELPGGMLIGGHRSVEISGCALGARVFIMEPLKVESLAFFALRDVEIKVREPMGQPLRFDGCGEVRLDSCRIAGIVPDDGALITIGGADRVQLEGNLIQALPLKPELLENLPVEVFDQVHGGVASLFEIRDRREFEDVALQVARELSQLSPDERGGLAARVRERSGSISGDRNLRAEERESYEKFARTLEVEWGDRLFPGRLLERLTGIRDAASPLTLQAAIVVDDAGCDVTLEGNEVSGVISLYGPPGPTRPNPDHLARLGAFLRRGSITLQESSGVLRLLNNKVTRLEVAERMVSQVIEISLGGDGEIGPVYGRNFLTDNVILSGNNLSLGYHLAFNSNAFNSLSEEHVPEVAGVAIGDSVTYVGNYAINSDITLDNASRVSEKAANLELIIIDH